MMLMTLCAPQDEELRHFQLVELNVIEQCLNLYKTGDLTYSAVRMSAGVTVSP